MRLLISIIFLIPLSSYAGEADKKIVLDPATVRAVAEIITQEFCESSSLYGETTAPFPLMAMVRQDMPKTVAILLQRCNKDPNEKNEKDMVSLYCAMENLHRYGKTLKGYEELVNKYPEDEHAKREQENNKKLFDKCKKIVNMIIDHPDFDQKKSEYIKRDGVKGNIEVSRTYPLDWAIKFEYFDPLEKLLGRTDAVYSPEFLKKFAPHAHACGKEVCDILMKKEPEFLQEAVVHSIVRRGSTISKSLTFLLNTYDITPPILDRALYYAVKRRNTHNVRVFMEKGARWNYHDEKTGDPIFMIRSEHHRPADIFYLYENIFPLIQGKNICNPQEQKNKKNGNTPFHYFFDRFLWWDKKYAEKMVNAFHELGLDHTTLNNKGQTPLHIFAEKYDKKQYKILLEKIEAKDAVTNCLELCEKIGIDKKIRDKEGKTAQDYVPQFLKEYFDDESERD
ncbi:MAG TPA: hypothetical protein VEK38_01700 [Candidatus Bathyarchaeia archaeon]|nr:hypothetical protein [Candidatus Bathyarchaeia archaeon]